MAIPTAIQLPSLIKCTRLACKLELFMADAKACHQVSSVRWPSVTGDRRCRSTPCCTAEVRSWTASSASNGLPCNIAISLPYPSARCGAVAHCARIHCVFILLETELTSKGKRKLLLALSSSLPYVCPQNVYKSELRSAIFTVRASATSQARPYS